MVNRRSSTTGAVNALSKLIGHLTDEVFGRKSTNPNKPINSSQHQQEIQFMDESVKARTLTNADLDYEWGPEGGVSDEVDVFPSAARWGHGANWG